RIKTRARAPTPVKPGRTLRQKGSIPYELRRPCPDPILVNPTYWVSAASGIVWTALPDVRWHNSATRPVYTLVLPAEIFCHRPNRLLHSASPSFPRRSRWHVWWQADRPIAVY